MPNFKFFFDNKSEVLDVVVHGGSQGMDSDFMSKITEASRSVGNSVVSFNFPYLERGEEHSSGPELLEEIETIRAVLDYCRSQNFKRIRLIGKSLGGTVVSYYLRGLSASEQSKYSAYILGYDVGDIDLKNFRGEIRIVQGEKDKYGNVEVIKKDMEGAISKNIAYIEIPGADHSYRVPETKEPKFEDEAIKVLFA